MILVTGAGGAVGGALAGELANAGHKARLAFHNPEKTAQKGPDAVTIDYARPETLTPAVDGIESVFLLSISGPAQAEHEGNLVTAARQAGVRRIVKLSAWRAPEELTPIGRFHHAAELVVRDGHAYDITGPAALSYAEAAAIFSTVLGRRITFRGQSDDHRDDFENS